jgi:flavin-binding protein dodecin
MWPVIARDLITSGTSHPARWAVDWDAERNRHLEEDAVSVYRVIDVIGTSTQSWEDAAVSAVSTARKSLRDLRVAEVVAQDLNVEDSGEIIFRTKLRVSFKYEEPA